MRQSSTSLSRASGPSAPIEPSFSKCPLCGSREIELGVETISLRRKANGAVRLRVRRWGCTGCGESFLTTESRRKLDAALGLEAKD